MPAGPTCPLGSPAGPSRGARHRVAHPHRSPRLTEREREVLAGVGAGLSCAEIASRLRLVEGTVKTKASAVLVPACLRGRPGGMCAPRRTVNSLIEELMRRREEQDHTAEAACAGLGQEMPRNGWSEVGWPWEMPGVTSHSAPWIGSAPGCLTRWNTWSGTLFGV
ncbi:helix-turn-helix transcriptional regulator [Streptomyces sp. NPDC048438]|uniref:helix-turn-helix domain-containing protein n=1 Tax=Streptomyces sp. NPDC048438 TaxID=3365551 RepID=UPI003722F0C8